MLKGVRGRDTHSQQTGSCTQRESRRASQQSIARPPAPQTGARAIPITLARQPQLFRQPRGFWPDGLSVDLEHPM